MEWHSVNHQCCVFYERWKLEVCIYVKGQIAHLDSARLPPGHLVLMVKADPVIRSRQIPHDEKDRAATSDLEAEHRKRERENKEYIGGLRRATRGVAEILEYCVRGDLLRSALNGIVEKHMRQLDILCCELGIENCAGVIGPIIEGSREVLARFFQIGARITEAGPHASDPEVLVPHWLTESAPLGMTNRIHLSEVFPEIGERSVSSSLEALLGTFEG